MAAFALNSAVNFQRLLVFVLVIFFPFRFCKDNHFSLWSKFQGALYFHPHSRNLVMGDQIICLHNLDSRSILHGGHTHAGGEPKITFLAFGNMVFVAFQLDLRVADGSGAEVFVLEYRIIGIRHDGLGGDEKLDC